MSWSDRELALMTEIGLDYPSFDLTSACWLTEFSFCSLWLHTSMEDSSAEEAYADAWIDFQAPPSRLHDFRYSYLHCALFRELACLSWVSNIWPHPSRCVLGAFLGVEAEMLVGLESALHLFMFYHERQIDFCQIVAGYCDLIDDVQTNHI